MSDNNIALTPSDIVGAVQRRLDELGMYLRRDPLAVDTGQVRQHLAGAIDLMDALYGMQLAFQASQGQGAANANEAAPEVVN